MAEPCFYIQHAVNPGLSVTYVTHRGFHFRRVTMRWFMPMV